VWLDGGHQRQRLLKEAELLRQGGAVAIQKQYGQACQELELRHHPLDQEGSALGRRPANLRHLK